MAQQTINLGTTDNDGTGDGLKSGGDKVNDNFTELYLTKPPTGGTDGQVLTKQSATDGDADWETPSVSGGMWSFVETVTATTASEIDIPIGTAEEYLVVLDVVTASDNVELHAQVTDDGFTSVESGASDYRNAFRRMFSNGNTYTVVDDAVDGETQMLFGQALGSGSGEFFRAIVRVTSPAVATRTTHFVAEGVQYNQSPIGVYTRAYSTYRTASVVDGFRVAAASGNITATAHVYSLNTA